MKPYPKEYIEYLVYFHADRDFFECHEIMEDYWKAQKGSNDEKTWLALIQIAVSSYHHRRGNIKGAQKMMESARKNMNACDLEALGLNKKLFILMLDERIQLLQSLNAAENYQDLHFPIQDKQLLQQCLKRCEERGVHWGRESNYKEEDIIHKHLRRDRTAVVAEREKQKRIRERKRKQP